MAGPSVLAPGRYVVTVPAPSDHAWALWRASRREAVRIATRCPSKAWRSDDPGAVTQYGIEVAETVTVPDALRASVGSWVRSPEVIVPARSRAAPLAAQPSRRVAWRSVGIVAGLGALGYLAARRAARLRLGN